MMRHSLFAVAAVLALTGCNTMLEKSYQKIEIVTTGVEYADCMLATEYTTYRVLSPGVAMVDRSRRPLTVTCQKAGYKPGIVTVESKVHMAGSQLNLFNGIVPGTAYDIASNSIYDYPDKIVIPMQADPSRLVKEEVRVSEPLKKKEVEVKPPVEPTPEAKAKTEKSLSKSLRK